MPTGRILAFAAAASLIIAIPGPSVRFIASRAPAHGRRAAVLTVIGNTIGAYFQVTVVAIGVGLVVERSLIAFGVLKLVGAAYLIFLGVRAIRERRSLESSLAIVSRPPTQDWQLVRQGIMVGATNPKSIVFLTAILPQFVVRSSGHVPAQMLLLGLVYAAIALVSDNLWGLSAGSFRSWGRSFSSAGGRRRRPGHRGRRSSFGRVGTSGLNISLGGGSRIHLRPERVFLCGESKRRSPPRR